MIDWAKPIETTDGVPLKAEPRDDSDGYAWLVTMPSDGDVQWHYDRTGEPRFNRRPSIRNVPEPAQPLYDRMLALVERIARDEVVANAEARAIIAELRPVDPDLVLARNLAADVCAAIGNRCDYVQFMRDGSYDDRPEVRSALAGIRGRVVAVDGRELAVQS